MAKPIIKFTAVPYEVNGHTGYRPSLESQPAVADLDFCKEVVTEKRLAMSADELLHAMEMVGEVGPAKVAQDGRPRGITKLLKWNRFPKGNLESPTSPWNDTCKAYVRPQLMSEATKIIDATFVNVASGIGVKLDNVTWIGAQTVVNVLKVGMPFAAYGRHMEWLEGDTATLLIGTTSHALTCTESDAAHAVFAWPAGLSPEAGTEATFVMLSRGGIEEGEVYTSKKVVTIIAGDAPTGPTITSVQQDGRPVNEVLFQPNTNWVINCVNLNPQTGDEVWIELYNPDDPTELWDKGNNTSKVVSATGTQIALNGLIWDNDRPDGDWHNAYPRTKVVIKRGDQRIEFPMTFVEE